MNVNTVGMDASWVFVTRDKVRPFCFACVKSGDVYGDRAVPYTIPRA